MRTWDPTERQRRAGVRRLVAPLTASVLVAAGCASEPAGPFAFCEVWPDGEHSAMLRTAPAEIEEAVGLYIASLAHADDPAADARSTIEAWTQEHC